MSRPGNSREGPENSREGPENSREGPGMGQDLETLKVPWSHGPGTKEVQKSRDFFEGPGTPRPLFLDRILLIRFTAKVHR